MRILDLQQLPEDKEDGPTFALVLEDGQIPLTSTDVIKLRRMCKLALKSVEAFHVRKLRKMLDLED